MRTTPGSITYAKISLVAEQTGLNHVELLTGHDDRPVYPNDDSLSAAFQEIGLDFGNDGSDPSKLTVDLTGALGRRSWPIASVGYLALRANSSSVSRSGNCTAKVTALLEFFHYVYTAGKELFHEGLAPLTDDASQEVLETIRATLKCDGERVYQYPPAPPKVTIQADESLHYMLQIMGDAFQKTEFSDLFIHPLESHLEIQRKFQCLGNESCTDIKGGFVVLADENLSSYILRDATLDKSYTLFTMPYCAMATGFIHNFCAPGDSSCPYRYASPLVLDLNTIAEIMDLKITHWNHSAIQRLNPDKLLPPHPIAVVAGPKTSQFHFDFIEVVRRAFAPSFSFLGGGAGSNTYMEAWIQVSLTPFAFSFVPFNRTRVEGVSVVSLVNRQGNVVAPDVAGIEACARDTYDAESNVFFVSSSQEPDCYPLVQVYNILMRNRVRFRTAGWLTNYLYERAVRDDDKEATVLTVSNLGTLVDLELDTIDLKQRNFLELESVVLLDGTSVVRVPHDLTLIPSSLVIVMYVVLAIELAVFFLLGVWVFMHRNRKLVRNSSPVFMIQVLIGASIMACTVIPLAQQDDHLVPRGMTVEQLEQSNEFLNRACVAQPVLFSLGFFIVFSALFLKR